MATTIKVTYVIKFFSFQSFSYSLLIQWQFYTILFLSDFALMKSNKYDDTKIYFLSPFAVPPETTYQLISKFTMLRGILLAAFAVIFAVYVDGHGRLWEPAGRGTEWRKGFWVPEPQRDYNDDQVYCGGRGVGKLENFSISVSCKINLFYIILCLFQLVTRFNLSCL